MLQLNDAEKLAPLGRRKFYDLQETHRSSVAEEALERMGALYAVESDIHGRLGTMNHSATHQTGYSRDADIPDQTDSHCLLGVLAGKAEHSLCVEKHLADCWRSAEMRARAGFGTRLSAMWRQRSRLCLSWFSHPLSLLPPAVTFMDLEYPESAWNVPR